MTSPAERKRAERARLAAKGIFATTLNWPGKDRPELEALAELLRNNPDLTFAPAFRDRKGRITLMKENRG